METPDYKESIEHIFDSYCKKCLKRNALDLQRSEKLRSEREVAFSDLTARQLASLSTVDEYFKDDYIFTVLGESVGVEDADLAEALTALPVDRREIILMSYFFDMTDREIAEQLDMKRRTITHQRGSSLTTLKNLMESEDL